MRSILLGRLAEQVCSTDDFDFLRAKPPLPQGLPSFRAGLFLQNGALVEMRSVFVFRAAACTVSFGRQICQKNQVPIVHFGLIACTVGIELSEKA